MSATRLCMQWAVVNICYCEICLMLMFSAAANTFHGVLQDVGATGSRHTLAATPGQQQVIQLACCTPARPAPAGQLKWQICKWQISKEKKRKVYAFRRQFNEKPSIIPGCTSLQTIVGNSRASDTGDCCDIEGVLTVCMLPKSAGALDLVAS